MEAKERQSRKERGQQIDDCPFKRKILLRDTIAHVPAPLADIIDNMHIAVQKEKIPLDVAFSASKSFCDSRGFTEVQFHQFISQKVPMPFEFCTSYEKLINQTTPPKREDFKSTLRGIETISEVCWISNKTPKGIMRSAVPLPCLFDVVKSQNLAGQRPRQGTKSCRMGRNSVRPSVLPSVRLSFRPFVCPSVRPSVTHSLSSPKFDISPISTDRK